MKPGKGAAFVRTKLRNYITGNTVERTFRAGEQVSIVWLLIGSEIALHFVVLLWGSTVYNS